MTSSCGSSLSGISGDGPRTNEETAGQPLPGGDIDTGRVDRVG